MCEFCENGKGIKAEYKGSGITTGRNMIDALLGGFGDDAVAHMENGKMWVDNSSGEYAELGFGIRYCPFCGAKMDEVEDVRKFAELPIQEEQEDTNEQS